MVKRLAFAVLMTLHGAVRAGQIPQDIQHRIDAEEVLEEKCQGYPQSLQDGTCKKRDQAYLELEKSGWCRGPAGAIEADKVWMSCPIPKMAPIKIGHRQQKLNTLATPQSIQQASNHCDALRLGDSEVGKQCEVDLKIGLQRIAQLADDPRVSPVYWAQCASSSGFSAGSYDWRSWASCVSFTIEKCDPPATARDISTPAMASYAKCVDAIQSGAWAFHSQ